MDEFFIFPTEHRGKHRKEVSYPLGAKDISLALHDVPQAPLIKLHFYSGNQQQILHKQPEIFVLSATYYRRARTHNDGPESKFSGVLDPRWAVAVGVVPSALRAVIRGQITVLLSTEVRDWFLTRAQEPDTVGTKSLSYWYETESKTLSERMSADSEPLRS